MHTLYFPLNHLVTQNAGSINKLRSLQEIYLFNRYKSNKSYTVQQLYVPHIADGSIA